MALNRLTPFLKNFPCQCIVLPLRDELKKLFMRLSWLTQSLQVICVEITENRWNIQFIVSPYTIPTLMFSSLCIINSLIIHWYFTYSFILEMGHFKSKVFTHSKCLESKLFGNFISISVRQEAFWAFFVKNVFCKCS